MNNQQIATKEPTVMEKLNTFLEKREDKFVAFNETVNKLNFASECNFARQQLMRNDKLLSAAANNQQSLADAISNVGAIGISLNPANKHAYLVPRKIGKEQAVCLDISYMGMIKLATDTGIVKYMKAELVYENDHFEYRGFDTRPDIKVKNPFDIASRGNLLGCIAWAKLNSGDHLNEFMPIDEINAIRDDSEAFKYAFKQGAESWSYKQCVWVKYYTEMVKKTVIKRLHKTLPSSDGSDVMSRAIEVLNEHEGIEFKDEPSKDYTDEQSAAYEKAIESGDYIGLLCLKDTILYEGQAQLFTLHELPRIEDRGKGKYDAMMKDALNNARESRDEILTNIRVACDMQDDIALQESTGGDLSQYTIDWYCNQLTSEQELFARPLLEAVG